MILGRARQEERRAAGLQKPSNRWRMHNTICFMSDWGTGMGQIWKKNPSLTNNYLEFQCSDDFTEAQTGYEKNLRIDILGFQVRQQKLGSISEQTGQRKSASSIRTSKGTLSFGAMLLFWLHKYCYSTAPLEGPGKMCARSPIGTHNWKRHM